MSRYGRWAPYVPVAQRLAQGRRKAQKRLKKGETLSPVKISGRAMAKTFWGEAWCDHFEQYSDFANRLPRGRTLARNGSIADLRIATGKITAMLCGSDLYHVQVTIQKIQDSHWRSICADCSGSVHSVIDLMRGKLSDEVIERLTDPETGMFPDVDEIKLSCSCPDAAGLCKHLAAVLYGAGNRLDTSPELLFVLRGVDQTQLISESFSADRVSEAVGLDQQPSIASDDLEAIFGIDLSDDDQQQETPAAQRKKAVKKRRTAAPKNKKKQAAKVKVVKKKVTRAKASKKKTAKGTKKKATAPPTASRKKAVKKAVKKKVVKKRAADRGKNAPTETGTTTTTTAKGKQAAKRKAGKKRRPVRKGMP